MIPRVIPVRGQRADRLISLGDDAPAQPTEERGSLSDAIPAIPAPPRRRESAPVQVQRVRVPPLLATIVGGALAALVLIALARSLPSAGPMRASQATAGAGAAADVPPSGIPTGAPVLAAARSLVAFAAPGGSVLGAIESTRVMTPTAHYGVDWLQVDAAGSGLIWLRAADAPELAIVGPDLEPTPTPIPPTPLPATPVPPTPEPNCVQVGTAGTQITRCGYQSLEQLQADAQAEWMTKNGAQPATLATVTPYPTIARSR